MTDDGSLRIDATVAIPAAELTFRATRSGGPGGQHVNTSSTRVELTWDIGASPSLTDEQRSRVMRRLAGRIDGSGVLHMASSRTRSTGAFSGGAAETAEAPARSQPQPVPHSMKAAAAIIVPPAMNRTTCSQA